MKKLIFTLTALLFTTLITVAQNVPRDKVILEIGTGTWCQYCPGAVMGADDQIANGLDVAVVEYHYGDDYQNSYSLSRVNYYNITGYPTAWFDGVLSFVGGSTTESMYPQYLSRVNQRLGVTSPFTIDILGSHTCFQDFTADITVEKVGTNSSNNLRLQAVLTESHIPATWFGLDEINYVCRKMMPDQNGTPLSFSEGNTQEVTLNFTLDPTWKPDELELVVFVQDIATKEIFQGTKMSLLDFIPDYDFDASVTDIMDLPDGECLGVMQPTVNIKNLGAQQLTSLNINYYVNDGDPMNYEWTGALDYLSEEEVQLPAISFIVEDSNELVVESELPNGNQDECTSNDMSTANVDRSMFTPNTVNLLLRTDDHPEETTWEVKDAEGNVLYSGGPYSSSGQMIQETFDLPEEACHSFTIYDAGGNGFDTPGFYLLYYTSGGNITISQGFDFGSEVTAEFNTADPVGVHENFVKEDGVTVYPNPFSGNTTFSFVLAKSARASIKVYSLTGQEVTSTETGTLTAGAHYINLDGSALKAGMYLYKVLAGDKSYTGKLVVR